MGLASLLVAFGSNASAQTADLLDKPLVVAIETQPVSTAIIELSRQAGVQIVMRSSGLGQQRSVAVSGTMSLQAALTQLLGAGRFRARQVGDNTITIDDSRENH